MTNITRRQVLGATSVALAPGMLAAASVPATQPVRLVANENPYGPSPSARAAAEAALDRAWQYAFREEATLKRLIAERENVDVENVLVTAGSTEALRMAALMYCRAPGELVSAHPTFPFLPTYAANLGAAVKAAPLTSDMTLNLDAMGELVSPNTRLVYICNPNNPTGTGLAGSALSAFLATLPNDVPVVVDEAYVELADDPAATTVIDRVRAGDPVIITRTFSKLHGLAGLRIGYLLARPDLVAALAKLRMSLANVVSLATAIASYRDSQFQAFSRARIEEGRQIVYRLCERFNAAYTRSQANFVLMRVGSPVDGFRQFMRERNLLVGREYPPYQGWCRISMGTVEQMELFAAAASEYFGARRS